MSKAFTPTAAHPGVITGNDLREGFNVWMCDDGWTPDPLRATIFEDEAIADLALLEAIGQADRVVGPYLVEAKRGPDGPLPVHFREEFRQRGPSNYFHGLQADRISGAQKTESTHV
ncbi:DUF2849 domain-containing protein [Paracoccus gahaiensis]|uniref:DUF2849 domain-containing protein n=1 Tax=Paracoccus gahaiensis TaxID=1706839 RepID=A0A4U0R6Q1_9RHOB|nr:DUF2849 domain-containing protein [Paracoccus gahaiensis]TJZ90701.1 DUF2849 domain-containing protein [Paracoccus gahaiensis]